MDLERIDQIAREVMLNRAAHRDREPGWLYHHGHRVAKIAQWLADEVGMKDDQATLYVGALFHDVSKGNEPHNETGAVRTRELLGALCTSDEIEAICELIWKHNLRGNAGESLAVKAVQDADILDHVGPIGPWLAFYYSGANGETSEAHKAFVWGEVNHRYRGEMRAMLNFEISRQEFDRRIQFEDDFFRMFHQVHQEGVWHREPSN